MNPIGMKRISKPPNGVILNELIGIWCLQGVYLGTLVFGKSVLKGSQSDLFVRTVMVAHIYNGGVHAALFREWSSTYQYKITKN
jgi:hypothetical protein